jgi:serine/threonine-protein kinase
MLQLGADQWQQAADDRRGLVLDRYLLGETLGQGGYGLVKRAYDMQNGSERAIKFIDIESVGDPAKRKQLLDDARREVETASRLRHPGLVRVHSLIVDGETIAIVQDLVRGAPLEMRRGERLNPLAALDLFVQLAHALTALHQAGLVHRDLKPGNVMVDMHGRPVLIDLGLAAVAGAIEEDGPLRGTRNYVAPELLVASRRPLPDPLQDVYALGVMLAEFLPGEALARPGGFFARAALSRAEPLAELVRRMRSRDPAQRPRTMAEISAALEQRRATLAV